MPAAPAMPTAANLPRHVAVIMDGNGRWASDRGLDRPLGHLKGAERVQPVLHRCVELGVGALTVYSFSTENWLRSQQEVSGLMELCVLWLAAQEEYMVTHNVRFRHLGRRTGLPPSVLEALDRSTAATAANTGTWFCLAFNYGSRTEITDAIRAVAGEAADGRLDPAAIDEAAVERHLGTAGLPDLDLLIRTAGDLRLSNYLLWQASYAEILVTPRLWPDFLPEDLDAAFAAYGRRNRTFGRRVDPAP